jgi:hypothetical protein
VWFWVQLFFDILILQDKHNIHTLSLNIKLICTAQSRLEKLCESLLFYLFLKPWLNSTELYSTPFIKDNFISFLNILMFIIWIRKVPVPILKQRGSNKVQCYLVMDLILIKHFWYPFHVERQKETITVQAVTSQMMPLKTIRTTLVTAIFRQFDSCFLTFWYCRINLNMNQVPENLYLVSDSIKQKLSSQFNSAAQIEPVQNKCF